MRCILLLLISLFFLWRCGFLVLCLDVLQFFLDSECLRFLTATTTFGSAGLIRDVSLTRLFIFGNYFAVGIWRRKSVSTGQPKHLIFIVFGFFHLNFCRKSDWLSCPVRLNLNRFVHFIINTGPSCTEFRAFIIDSNWWPPVDLGSLLEIGFLNIGLYFAALWNREIEVVLIAHRVFGTVAVFSRTNRVLISVPEHRTRLLGVWVMIMSWIMVIFLHCAQLSTFLTVLFFC